MRNTIALNLFSLATEAEESSLNAGQDLTQLGNAVHELTDFLDSDIAKNDQEIVALEAQIVDLVSLMQLANSQKAISKKMALEAERIVPGFIKGGIEYYTDEPTKTMFNVSMEEMSTTVKAFIVALIAAVAAIIYKLIKWIMGSSIAPSSSTGSSGSPSAKIDIQTATPQDFDAAKKELKANSEQFDNQFIVSKKLIDTKDSFDDFLRDEPMRIYLGSNPKEIYLDDGRVDESKLTLVDSLEKFITLLDSGKINLSEREKHILHEQINPTKYTVDIIETGKLSKAYIDVMEEVSNYTLHLRDVSAVYTRSLSEVVKTGFTYDVKSNANIHAANVTKINKDAEVTLRINVDGQMYKPNELDQKLKQMKHDLNQDSTRTRYNYGKLCNSYFNIPDKAKFHKAFENCIRLLDIVQDISKTITKNKSFSTSAPVFAGEAGNISLKHYDEFAKASKEINEGVAGIGALIHALKAFVRERQDILVGHITFYDLVISKLYTEVKKAGTKPSARLLQKVTDANEMRDIAKKGLLH